MDIAWTTALQVALPVVLQALLQALLPIALLATLALRTPASRAGFWAHSIVTALVLPALALAARWTLLPWWTPYLYAVALLAVGAALHGARALPSPRWPAGRTGRAHLMACAVTGLAAALLCAEALRGRIAQGEAALDLQFPLPAGDYLVLDGGNTRLVNANRAAGTDDAASLGIDLVRLNGAGLRAEVPASPDPTRYFMHGTRVLSPCDGSVLDVHDGRAERPVPGDDTASPLGNRVRLQCGDAIVTLAHLREGSLRVRPGDTVTIATLLARVGNSGAATEPSLHMHAERAGKPLLLRFDGRSLVRNDRIGVARAARQPAAVRAAASAPENPASP